jgi:Phycobilisome degradation protein nblA
MNPSPIEINPDLTLEQKFQMQVLDKVVQYMSREQAVYLLLETSKLLMVKDNMIKSLLKQIL